MSDFVPVRVRDCNADLHPDGDFAYLKPEADLDIGLAVHGVIGRSIADPDLLQVELGRAYLRFGIVRWDIHEPDGTPIPTGSAGLARLRWPELFPLADKAAELYGDVLLPLVASLSKSSRSGQTGDSTSAKTPSTRKRRKP